MRSEVEIRYLPLELAFLWMKSPGATGRKGKEENICPGRLVCCNCGTILNHDLCH